MGRAVLARWPPPCARVQLPVKPQHRRGARKAQRKTSKPGVFGTPGLLVYRRVFLPTGAPPVLGFTWRSCRRARGGGHRARRDRPTPAPRQQDRAEYSRARNNVDDRADEQGHADPEGGSLGVAEPGGCLDDGLHHHGLGDPVEGQKRDHEGAHDAARPARYLRGDPGGSARALDRCLSVHLRPPSVFLHRRGAVYRL